MAMDDARARARRRCEETLAGLAARAAGEVPLHGAQLPQPGRRDAGDRAAGRDRRDLRAARRADLEDNPYGLLGFDGEPLPALRALAPDGVVYLGSFSKTFAPGVRVGWALAPHADAGEARAASESQVLCPPMLSQLAVVRIPVDPAVAGADQGLPRDLPGAARRDARRARRSSCRPGRTWTTPDGGFYVWVTLPEGLDAKVMLPRGDHRAGGVRPRHRRSTPTAPGSARCGCPTATPTPGADPRGRAPAGRRGRGRSWSCARRFGAEPSAAGPRWPRRSAPGPELA